MTVQVHPTAIVEDGVAIGAGTTIWDGVHVRGPAEIGENCIIGEKTYIAYGVVVGDLVKINAHVYVCTGVTINRGVMISAGVIFTNDRAPRAATPDLDALLPSQPGADTLETVVEEGATIGAGAVLGPGLRLGRFCMVGRGSVVTKDVADHEIVVGNPAVRIGFACRCGARLPGDDSPVCDKCGRSYTVAKAGLEDRI